MYYPTYNRLDGLLTGVVIAALYNFWTDTWSKLSQYGNLLLLFGLVTLGAAYYVCYDEHSFYASIFGFPLVSLGYGFLVMGAISPGSILFQWKSKSTSFIAMLSYGIYLIHKGVIHMTQYILDKCNVDTSGNVTFIISIAACIFAAYVLNVIIEKPFMRARSIFLKS